MSGPTPMTLGPFAFQALGFGYNNVKRHLDTSWATVDVAGRMEALHWVGPKSDSVTIGGVLFSQEFGGQETLESVRAAAKSGIVLPLITGDGSILGLFAVQGVDEDRHHHDAQGQPRKNAYTIKLKVIEGAGFGSLFAGVTGGLSRLF